MSPARTMERPASLRDAPRALLLAVALIGSVACVSGDRPAAVAIRGFTYGPSTLRVDAGATVTWTNDDEILHTATAGVPGSPTKEFDGTMDGRGEKFRYRFAQPGTYPYFCSRHNGMRGEIAVGSA